MSDYTMTIGQAAKESGLTPYVLRAWEKRYGLTASVRTKTNRRLYSKEDVRKLTLLAELTGRGYSIGQIASLPIDELQLMSSDLKTTPDGTGLGVDALLESALERVSHMDAIGLQEVLHLANVELSKPKLISEFITPLLHEVGERWARGDMRVAQEHMCAASVRSYLSQLLLNHGVPEDAPTVIVCTSKGQEHEIGALAAAFTAKMTGWNVCYLGSNMPAEEIAAGSNQVRAAAILLSISYPTPDILEFESLRKMIPDVPIFVGGRVVDGLRDRLIACGCKVMDGLENLPSELRREIFSRTK